MKYLSIFFLIFLLSCNIDKTNNNQVKNTPTIEKTISQNKILIEKKDSISKLDKKIDSINNKIIDWTDYEKKLDFVTQTGINDSIILLKHKKTYSKSGYVSYYYSFIDFNNNSQFHNHNKQSKNLFDTIYLDKTFQIDSLQCVNIAGEISKNWCQLFKYSNLICSARNRLRDIRFDSTFFMIRYMDGFFKTPIAKIDKKDNNNIEILLYNRGSINSGIFDSLNIHFIDTSGEIGIFQFVNYNYKNKKFHSNYDLYATSDYCQKLPVFAEIENEDFLNDDTGIEHNTNWDKYLKNIQLLKDLLKNSDIIDDK